MLHFWVVFTHLPCQDLQESSRQERNWLWKIELEVAHFRTYVKTIFSLGIPTHCLNKKINQGETAIFNKIWLFSQKQQIQKIKSINPIALRTAKPS